MPVDIIVTLFFALVAERKAFMLDDLFRRQEVRRRIRGNPLGSVLERYVDYLVARGHSAYTTHSYVFSVEHFGRWHGRRKVDRKAVNRFIKQHLPSCRCMKPAARHPRTVRAALNRLLEMIDEGLSGSASDRDLPVASLLGRYADHLDQVQGLAPATITYRIRYARALMASLRIHQVHQLRAITIARIQRFVTGEGCRCRPSSVQVTASSIRCFFRFLLLYGLIDRDLSIVVPAMANWRLASLPATVSEAELERLLAVVDTATPIGLRDRAILLCLIDLGLRTSDVAALELNGMDLAARTLYLRQRKRRQSSALPMTKRLVRTIEAYVREGRPACTTAALFVLHRAPRGAALTVAGVRSVVLRYVATAGLTDRIRSAHVIRHSVASRLINSGATLKQVADLLGHRSLDTTTIYTKVDIASLTAVALPWPGCREVTS